MMDVETNQFERYRPLMFSIAYRMLGSASDAEDMVQETYLRYRATPAAEIVSHKAFLSTIITRLCLNQLQSARDKRETYIGPWLPEPILTESDSAPAQQAELHESISIAFLALLEQLTPLERAVFLLREVFSYEYAEIADIMVRDEAACRQIFSRAKKHIAEHRPRFTPSRETHQEILNQFIRAANTGELDGLMQILTMDVTLWADGGGKARGAALHPLHGREAVARFILGSVRLFDDLRAEIMEVNGEPSVVIRSGEHPVVVLAITADGGQISEIRAMGNPDKLKWVDRSGEESQ